MKGFKSRQVFKLATALAAIALGSLTLASSALAQGAFVIADQNAAIGSQVNFWGAQWWMNNSLSGGLAPSAFKGFADSSTPACGEQWTTAPGDSSQPPATIGSTIPVVVSSLITQSGNVISGNTVEVVSVSVDPNYTRGGFDNPLMSFQPDPGHPAYGTVVGVICPASPTVTAS